MSGWYTKVSGTWRDCSPWVKVSGTWREIQEGWVKVSGTWQQFFANLQLALPTSISSSGFDLSSPYDARGGVKVDTDGYMYRLVTNAWSQVSGTQYWINDKTATMSNYECYLSGTGSTPNLYGLSLNTWYTLSVDRAWGIQQTTPGSKSFNGTLQIREIANTSNVVSCSISLSAEAGAL